MKKAKRQGTTWKAWGMVSHLEYLERVCMEKGDREGKSRPEVPDGKLKSLYFLLEVLRGPLKQESGDGILHFKKLTLILKK